MGWEIGYDEKWKRDIGYGVPAYCDHPRCHTEIDRGISHVCSGEPYGDDYGCGLYFCEQHHAYWKNDNEHALCARCYKGKEPFNPKPEHPEWLAWKETDPSWAEWRKERNKR